MRARPDAADTPNQMPGFGKPITVVDAPTGVALHPVRTFIYRWNWKAALLSAALRAPIFLVGHPAPGYGGLFSSSLAQTLFHTLVRFGRGKDRYRWCHP